MQERLDYQVAKQQSNVMVINAFMQGVYRWMGVGLAVTAAIAWLMLSYLQSLSEAEMMLFMQKYGMLFLGLLIGEVVLVIALSAAVHKMSGATATLLFLLYSALNGLTFSVILYGYQVGSIASAFVSTAAMFGAMSVYGMFTKRDLTSLGRILMMGLIGLVVAMLVNMFVGSSRMDYLISIIGVIIFTGLIAYDSQKLRQMGESMPHDDATAVRRGTIMGALTLYLDFINLFLFLLRLFGDRR